MIELFTKGSLWGKHCYPCMIAFVIVASIQKWIWTNRLLCKMILKGPFPRRRCVSLASTCESLSQWILCRTFPSMQSSHTAFPPNPKGLRGRAMTKVQATDGRKSPILLLIAQSWPFRVLLELLLYYYLSARAQSHTYYIYSLCYLLVSRSTRNKWQYFFKKKNQKETAFHYSSLSFSQEWHVSISLCSVNMQYCCFMLFLMLFYGKPLESHLVFVYKSLFPRDQKTEICFYSKVDWN